jgi:hypothetical protein
MKAVADDIEVVLPRDVERKDSELAAEIAPRAAESAAGSRRKQRVVD